MYLSSIDVLREKEINEHPLDEEVHHLWVI